jgi:UDP-glucuronate decarboxylase
VVSNFIVQALQNHDITIYGDGSQTRAFCYVDDLDGLIRLMNSPEAITGPVNLGNPGEFSIRELAEAVIDLVGASSRIVHMPLPTDDPRQRRPDISKANELLDWKPSVPVREGLVKTISYFERLLKTEPVPA